MTGTLAHPTLGQVKYEVTAVPTGGDGQTSAVVSLMSRYALEDSRHPIVIVAAQEAVRLRPDAPPHEAVFWYVKDRIRFVRDEETVTPWQNQTVDPVVEALIRPVDMIAMCNGGASCQRVGDCDDFSMLTAALLTALGIDAAFVTVAASRESDDFSHVYVAAYPNGVRVPLDTSHGPHPGWETPNARRTQEWPVSGAGGWIGMITLVGLGAYLWRKLR